MSRLEKLRARHNNVRKETGAELAKSKERLVRERMAQSEGLNWYSQRFNASGRMFFLDTSEGGSSEGHGSSSDISKNVTKKLPLEKLRERHNNVMKETGAELAKSKERLARQRMEQAQGLNWYSQRFNESGRQFFMETSGAGGEVSGNNYNSKEVAKEVPLKKLPENRKNAKKETGGEHAQSKERLARQKMAQSRLNWYSQRFNESGRQFFMDTDAGEATSINRSSEQPVKKVPLHIKLKKENEKLRRKLEKTESDRKLLKQRVAKVGVPNLGTDKAILKTKLREAKAHYTTLEVELSDTKNELSQKEASTTELLEKMKHMKAAYDALAKQMHSRRGSFSTIPEDGNIDELQEEVNGLKQENRRLLFEKELSMRQSFLGSISENHLDGSQATKLSTTTLDLTDAEMKVIEAAEELKDTQDALDHAQSLIQKLEREKEALAKKMESQLDRSQKSSRIDSSQRSTGDTSQKSTIDTSSRSMLSPSKKKTRGLSMVVNDLSNGDKTGKVTFIDGLSDVDSSVSSFPQEELDRHPETSKSRKKWRRSTLNQDFHTLNGQDLNIVNQASIFSTSLLLICGFPLLALACSAGSIIVYVFQKDHSLPFHKDVQKYFLINCTGAIMSFGSWSLRAQAMEDPSRTLRVVFAALVRQFSGFVLAWFLYTDYITSDYEPEALDIIEVKVKIFGGKNLVAKDRNIFGRAISSDPYVRIYHARNYIGKTQIVWKTLNPIWSAASFSIMALPSVLDTYSQVICHIYDHDTLSADDSMGTVAVPIPPNFNEKVRKWYPVTNGSGDNYCRNASGHLDVEIVVLSRVSKEGRKRASINGLKRNLSAKPTGKIEKTIGPGNAGGVQSLGEITAETKVQTATNDALVVKI